MKSIINILVILIISGTYNDVRSQTSWGNWITVYTEGAKSIQISFKYSKWGNTCYPKGGGYHFFRIKNDFNEKVGGTILFDNTDCDGKNHTNNASFYFEGAKTDESMGQWFLGQSGITNIHLRKAPDFYDRKNKSSTSENSNSVGNKPPTNTNGLANDNDKGAADASNETTIAKRDTEVADDHGKKNESSQQSSPKEAPGTRTTGQLEKERQDARLKYIKDSTDATWKERNDRVEQVKKDQQEKAAVTAGMAAGVGALMFSETNNSKIIGKRTYFKAGAFMGMKNIPVYENMNSYQERAFNYTSAKDHLPIYVEAELQAMLYKSKWFSFEVTPYFQYGQSFYGGDNGTYVGYGGNSTITFGNKLKIYAVAGYEARSGENTYDMDAGSESIGIITNTKAIGTSSYDYSVISYGGGLILDTNSGDENEAEDKFIQLGGIIHKPSLTDARNSQLGLAPKQLIGGQFKWALGGGFTFAGEYIPDYTIAGTKTYEPRSKDKKDYWFVKIGKVFNL